MCNIGSKKEIGEMQDFLAKLCKKVQFPGVIVKYMKRLQYQHFNILTHLFLKKDNFVIFGKMVSQFSCRDESYQDNWVAGYE